jgi:hypothetical protein
MPHIDSKRPSNVSQPKEPNMNAISISIVAIVITAALAAIAPVTHYTQHEIAVLDAHAANSHTKIHLGTNSGLTA